MVEARQDGDWVWSVEGVVVVGGGMPVIGVIITPEALVVIIWKTQSIIMPAVYQHTELTIRSP